MNQDYDLVINYVSIQTQSWVFKQPIFHRLLSIIIMHQQLLLLTVISSICICSIYAGKKHWWWLSVICLHWCFIGETIKYASSCSVDVCALKNATNSTGNGTNSGGCPNIPLCYNFETSINTSFCAPQVVCSLFDACTSAKKCATNTTVCVINTCCPAPICMPLSLTSGCSMYTSTTVRNSWSGMFLTVMK